MGTEADGEAWCCSSTATQHTDTVHPEVFFHVTIESGGMMNKKSVISGPKRNM